MLKVRHSKLNFVASFFLPKAAQCFKILKVVLKMIIYAKTFLKQVSIATETVLLLSLSACIIAIFRAINPPFNMLDISSECQNQGWTTN